MVDKFVAAAKVADSNYETDERFGKNLETLRGMENQTPDDAAKDKEQLVEKVAEFAEDETHIKNLSQDLSQEDLQIFHNMNTGNQKKIIDKFKSQAEQEKTEQERKLLEAHLESS